MAQPGAAIPAFRGRSPIPPQPKEWYTSGKRIESSTGGLTVTANKLQAEKFIIKTLAGRYKQRRAAEIAREIATHRWLSHPAVPPLRDVSLNPAAGAVHLVFTDGGFPILDFIDDVINGRGAIVREPNLDVDRVMKSMVMESALVLTSVLGRIHSAGWCYNDLKPCQMVVGPQLVEGGPSVKLVDFGAVTRIGTSELLATSWSWIPPEAHRAMANGAGWLGIAATKGPAFDVWSMTLTLLTIALKGKYPYRLTLFEKAAPAPYPVPAGTGWNPKLAKAIITRPQRYEQIKSYKALDEDFKEFVALGLNPDPQRRATLADLRATRWYARCQERYVFQSRPQSPGARPRGAQPAPAAASAAAAAGSREASSGSLSSGDTSSSSGRLPLLAGRSSSEANSSSSEVHDSAIWRSINANQAASILLVPALRERAKLLAARGSDSKAAEALGEAEDGASALRAWEAAMTSDDESTQSAGDEAEACAEGGMQDTKASQPAAVAVIQVAAAKGGRNAVKGEEGQDRDDATSEGAAAGGDEAAEEVQDPKQQPGGQQSGVTSAAVAGGRGHCALLVRQLRAWRLM